MGKPAAGVGFGQQHDMLAANRWRLGKMASGWHLAMLTKLPAHDQIDWKLAASMEPACPAPGGQETGPNPTDRGKFGSKRHVIVDAQGVPLAITVKGTNRHDSTAVECLAQYVKSQKNDRNDAEAIVEAASRPTMRYVAVDSVQLQDIQSMHRIRSLLMRDRIAQINQIRVLLAEYGVVVAKTALKVRQQLPAIIDDECNELTGLTRSMMRDMYERFVLLDQQIARYDESIHQVHKTSPSSQRLEKIRGVGPLIATAVIAAAGSTTEFSNGRQFVARLGLTLRQHPSGVLAGTRSDR